MKKLFCLGMLLLSLGSLRAKAQGAPPLDVFTSPDHTFQFVYPQSYELLVGERILKGTQGRRSGIPVCDFSKALACVIYPIETNEEETKFEAAGFSVDAVPGVTRESECLEYSDQVALAPNQPLHLTSTSINSRPFRHASARKKMPGHLQATDFYRTFHKQKCYQLKIAVSVSDDANVQRQSGLAGDATADNALESLRLILSSVIFPEE